MKYFPVLRRSVPRTLCCCVVTFIFLAAGCKATRPPMSSTTVEAEQAAVKKRLAEILDAAETKDFPRLDGYHAYGSQFTKFASSGQRLDSAAAREGEHAGLRAAAGLKLEADDLKIDVFGNTAVATFIAAMRFQSGAEKVTKRERCTLVLTKTGGSWKIVHEHFSPGQ